jgi:hypothetical protein
MIVFAAMDTSRTSSLPSRRKASIDEVPV